jgi:uncharacterized membrane protein YsdA (DUF1294 family)
MTPATEILIALYLLAVNALAVGSFWLDKRRAEMGGWRVPEQTLLAIALCGGSTSALCARQLFRHKTRTQPFGSRLNSIAIFHLLVVAIWLATMHPR